MSLTPVCQENDVVLHGNNGHVNDWLKRVLVRREDYLGGIAFAEPPQEALAIRISVAHPSNLDIRMEVTRNKDGEILLKVVNSQLFSKLQWKETKIEGAYTLMRFSSR